MPKKKGELSIEERLEQSIVAKEEEPYKLPSNWVWRVQGPAGVFSFSWELGGVGQESGLDTLVIGIMRDLEE